ncbi:hypothetical protein EVAR_70675_1 [Eumeta japonica]|uniref:Uncharacterized protein n=1 Tax=Eumeta variegata TaxID=151549 RepID=A0A4C1SA20_EUMVA|nr:hypothetical protein EVAR_70675_1 [Eumeta japonica]
MQHLQNNLAELTAQIESRRLNFISNSNVDQIKAMTFCRVEVWIARLAPGNKTDDRCSPRRRRAAAATSPRSRRVSLTTRGTHRRSNVIMYSDEFGRSMGLQLSRRLPGKIY